MSNTNFWLHIFYPHVLCIPWSVISSLLQPSFAEPAAPRINNIQVSWTLQSPLLTSSYQVSPPCIHGLISLLSVVCWCMDPSYITKSSLTLHAKVANHVWVVQKLHEPIDRQIFRQKPFHQPTAKDPHEPCAIRNPDWIPSPEPTSSTIL